MDNEIPFAKFSIDAISKTTSFFLHVQICPQKLKHTSWGKQQVAQNFCDLNYFGVYYPSEFKYGGEMETIVW